MTRRPITVHRASVAIELRYNLFRHKWHPDLCCAVPEHHPVPSFVTGERWDFGGTCEGVIPPPGLHPTAAELGVSTRREDMPVILRVAAADGLIVRVERDRYFARKALEEFEAALRELGRDGEIGIGALRERLGLSRKYLIPLLEWADREGLTVRIGDTRRLRPSSSG